MTSERTALDSILVRLREQGWVFVPDGAVGIEGDRREAVVHVLRRTFSTLGIRATIRRVPGGWMVRRRHDD